MTLTLSQVRHHVQATNRVWDFYGHLSEFLRQQGTDLEQLPAEAAGTKDAVNLVAEIKSMLRQVMDTTLEEEHVQHQRLRTAAE